MATTTYRVKKSENGQFTVGAFRNGNIMNSTETYKEHGGAMTNIRSSILGHNPQDETKFKVIDLSKNISFNYLVQGGKLFKDEQKKLSAKDAEQFS